MSSAEDLRDRREEALDYFTAEFRKILEENFDDHIENFGKYVKG